MKILCIGHAAYDITLPVDFYPIENSQEQMNKHNKTETES